MHCVNRLLQAAAVRPGDDAWEHAPDGRIWGGPGGCCGDRDEGGGGLPGAARGHPRRVASPRILVGPEGARGRLRRVHHTGTRGDTTARGGAALRGPPPPRTAGRTSV